MSLVLKQRDTYPSIEATFEEEIEVEGVKKKEPVDLTDAETIKLILKLEKGATVVEGVCEIVGDPTEGKVAYAQEEEDTAVIGQYRAEGKVTWKGGRVESFPNEGYDTVTIEESL